MGKRGANYVGETAIRGKDITLETVRTTAEYADKAAGMMKDAALDVGWNMANVAGDTAEGMAETIGNMSSKAKDVVVDTTRGLVNIAVGAGQKGASYIGNTSIKGKYITLEAEKTTAEYAGKAAASMAETIENMSSQAKDVVTRTTMGLEKTVVGEGKDVALETGRTTTEYAGNTAGVVRDVDLEEKGASYVGETAVRGKDITLEAGTRTTEYVGKTVGVLKDAALDVGWNTTKFAG
nr:hypothetical protein [Tanacetum cinerariifolium]